MSPPSGADERLEVAEPERRWELWFRFAAAVAALAGIGSARPHTPLQLLIGVPVTAVALWFLAAALTSRLEFGPTRMNIRHGPFLERSVLLADVISLKIKGTRWGPVLIVTERNPRSPRARLTLDLMVRFGRKDEWAPLLLEAARRNGWPGDAEVERLLA